ncbi:MAG: riboflavin synthase [Oscillospiraceae bacterium]|nr:riboflavin synthase [Oscillospiraceae bacterium]
MFTGIIEEVGTVQSFDKTAASAVLTISATTVLNDLPCGASIAVNGVCLTVTSFTDHSFSADVMHETLRCSSLGQLHSGNKVNLERAMPADGRFGGHIVTGHIDGTGTVQAKRKDGNAVWFTIRTAPEIFKYIIRKGSIAVDGISLTVAEVTGNSFSVSVIPHTAEMTTLLTKHAGSLVNLENDCIGKYVEKFVSSKPAESGLTRGLLRQLEE